MRAVSTQEEGIPPVVSGRKARPRSQVSVIAAESGGTVETFVAERWADLAGCTLDLSPEKRFHRSTRRAKMKHISFEARLPRGVARTRTVKSRCQSRG